MCPNTYLSRRDVDGLQANSAPVFGPEPTRLTPHARQPSHPEHRDSSAAPLRAGLGFRESVHAAAHAVLSVLPLFIMCGSNDVATGVQGWFGMVEGWAW